jgi:hypothetical protein
MNRNESVSRRVCDQVIDSFWVAVRLRVHLHDWDQVINEVLYPVVDQVVNQFQNKVLDKLNEK